MVGVDTEQYDPANPEKYLKALLRDETNPLAQRAFRSYLGVVPSPPVGFENFSEQVNRYMEQPPFNFPNPLIYIGAYKTVSVGSTGIPCLRIGLSLLSVCLSCLSVCLSVCLSCPVLSCPVLSCLSVYLSTYLFCWPYNLSFPGSLPSSFVSRFSVYLFSILFLIVPLPRVPFSSFSTFSGLLFVP